MESARLSTVLTADASLCQLASYHMALRTPWFVDSATLSSGNSLGQSHHPTAYIW